MIRVVTTMGVTHPNESPTVSHSVSLAELRFHHCKCICVSRQTQPLLLIPQVQPEASLRSSSMSSQLFDFSSLLPHLRHFGYVSELFRELVRAIKIRGETLNNKKQ